MGHVLKTNLSKWLLPLLLALTFVVGQQHVLTHPISHIQDEQSQTQHDSKHSTHGSFCGECASLVNLAGALPSIFFPLALVNPEHVLANVQFARAIAFFDLHYSARAPPSDSR